MAKERLFLDTAFVQAFINSGDRHHQTAAQLFPRVRNAAEVWTTEAILMEVGNALSASNRSAATKFIKQCYQTQNIRVVAIASSLFLQGVDLYESRPDKTWGLVDCISFVVMEENNLSLALTSDRHFIQAGFQALLI